MREPVLPLYARLMCIVGSVALPWGRQRKTTVKLSWRFSQFYFHQRTVGRVDLAKAS